MADESRLMIPYEFPLAGGARARMRLPADLTTEDAERLCAMIRALAFGGPPTGEESS